MSFILSKCASSSLVYYEPYNIYSHLSLLREIFNIVYNLIFFDKYIYNLLKRLISTFENIIILTLYRNSNSLYNYNVDFSIIINISFIYYIFRIRREL